MFKRNEEAEYVEEVMENGAVKVYLKGRSLGKGGFAECYQFQSQETGLRYAAKVITKESLSKGKAKEKLHSQIVIHKGMRHRHIVKFEHFFQDHEYVYILLELCSNNTLNELLKRRKVLTEMEVRYYMNQLLSAVKHIHNQRVIHRDLKLGNFFLSDKLEVKVGDFGLATALSHEGQRRKTVCGTPNYIAPEILENKKGHSYEVDIWSLGVVAFAFLFGKPPFQTNDVKSTYEKIKLCEYAFPTSKVSEPARRFVARMLRLNPSERATIDELLTDQFLTNEEIPQSLPRSTLACPPSKTLIEQLKHSTRVSLEKSGKIEEGQLNINSSRTSKESASKYKGLMATAKVEVAPSMRKSERSICPMTRTTSTAAMVTRKKTTSTVQQQVATAKIWISFFQQQPKYGLFYRLNTQQTGMRFNDTTCLISNQRFTKFRYVTMQNGKEAEVQIFQWGQQSESLQRKMKIISHFFKQLRIKEEGKEQPRNPLNRLRQDSVPSSVYVIAYYVTSHYTMFWLSNGSFHTKFKDGLDMLVESEQLICFGKESKKSIIKLSKIAEANEDVRVRYTHVAALIKKVRKLKTGVVEDSKKDKQNPPLQQSTSTSKLSKAKDIPRRQFSSSSNIQLLKRPLNEYASYK